MARKHQFCDFSVCTQRQCQWQIPQYQRWIAKEKRKEKVWRVRGKQNAIWGRNATYSLCEGVLPWIHKKLWQHVVYWGSNGLQNKKHIFRAWIVVRTTYSMYKLVIFTLVNNFQILQTTWIKVVIFSLSQVCCQYKWHAKYCIPHT